ncbi:MAG TPA: penicillin acylase family protein, partial [Pyrinomonadaceae bacterium]|nr:penicillin acylase family protein [Pyrinomonadaceae bacterium]
MRNTANTTFTKYTISAILFGFSTFFLTFSAFGQQTSIALGGLKESVTVRRDARSIPYIEAKNDSDLYFTQGYITASDRLWQMDLMRRVARGELSELFGNRTLDEDERWRKFGFAKIAEESLAKLTPQLRTALEEYARGVNAYIATLDGKSLPIEFKILQYKPREWAPADTIVIGKILADALSSTWRQDLLRLQLDKLPKEKLADLTNRITPFDVVLYGKDKGGDATVKERVKSVKSYTLSDLRVSDDIFAAAERDEQIQKQSLERVGLYAEDLAASNNWVISGTRTADGKPLLANDPHLEPNAPGIWYLTHLTAPGMSVSGVTIPGVPGIILGHNEYIAWGATNVGPDVQDLYAERFDDNGQYKTPGGFASPVTRTETINVRSSPLKTDVEKVSLEVVETRNGVIVAEDGGKKYALKWTARDPANSEFESFYYLNRAKDWSEFTQAIRTYGG